MTRHRHAALPGVALIAVLLVVMGVLVQPASAVADDESAPVSWSVSPADESSPDGRTAVEHELDPGESVVDHIAVRNLGTEEIIFRLSAADGYYTTSGRFDMLPSDSESAAAGTWITLPDAVTVAAGGTVIVPFTVAVPGNAEPGDHAAGVAASVLSIQQGDGTGVGVESRVGVKVMIRVAGEITPTFAVNNTHFDYQMSWNPFRAGSVTVQFDIENTGNARLDTKGVLDLAGQQIAFPAEGERRQQLLPGESRSFSLVVKDVWPLFALTGEVRLTPSAVALDGGEVGVEPRSVSIFLWAVPWAQLLIVVGIALILLALLYNKMRSRRRVDDLISAAEERGREQARAELPTQEGLP